MRGVKKKSGRDVGPVNGSMVKSVGGLSLPKVKSPAEQKDRQCPTVCEQGRDCGSGQGDRKDHWPVLCLQKELSAFFKIGC
jgi:hypothetical protein